MKIKKFLVSIIPQNKISYFMGKLMKSKISKYFIKLYVKYYDIDLSIVEKDISEFNSLNEFFTRQLKEGARVIDSKKDSIVSPVDGVVAQFGKIEDGLLIQAKGINYSLEQLLGDKDMAKIFNNGQYMTIYLSPKDYHRIHMTHSSNIVKYDYVPGRLYPVNDIGITQIKGLYTKNERLTTYFEDEKGCTALVKVGALIVGSVQIAYEDNVHQKHRGKRMSKALKQNIYYEKGKELGRFEFGSTVIFLMDEKIGVLDENIKLNQSVKMGERIGFING